MIIPKTVFGTSDPIDIYKGFALFASNARALQLGFNASRTLLQTNPQLLAWRLNMSAGYEFFAGVCGPAYALRFDAEGQTTGNQIQLNITNDETSAGFVVGLRARLFLNIAVENMSVAFIADGWNSRFESQWNTIVNLSPSVDLDLLEILKDLILKFFGSRNQTNTKLEKSNSKLDKVVSYGMFDSRKGQWASNGGALEVSPSFSLPVNLVPYTKAAPPPANALWIADQALQALWGGFELGPRLTIAIPVKIALTRITVEHEHYENLTFDGSKVTGTGGKELPQAGTLFMSLSEQPGFSITLEFYISLSVAKLFSVEASVPLLDITGLLGIKVQAGPFQHILESRLGAGPVNRMTLGADGDGLAAAPIEVILEPPVESVA